MADAQTVDNASEGKRNEIIDHEFLQKATSLAVTDAPVCGGGQILLLNFVSLVQVLKLGDALLLTAGKHEKG